MDESAHQGEAWDGNEFIATHYSTLQQVICSVSRRYRLARDEADELRSIVHLKLIDNNFAVLRKFARRSSLATYLTIVIARILLDQRISAWGKWRPSAGAQRQGAVAIRLERLVTRDGLSFDEAATLLQTDRRLAVTRDALEQMRGTFTVRQRPRILGQDVLEALPACAIPTLNPHHLSKADEDLELSQRRALARALVALPSNDRQLLRLRYRRGWTIARVAQELQLDPKRTYREFERVHQTLRTMLVRPHSTTTGSDRETPMPSRRFSEPRQSRPLCPSRY